MMKLSFKFPNLAEKLKRHQIDVMGVLAAAMQTNRAMMFDKDGADNGKDKWDPLVFRSGRPLQDRGTLRKSLSPRNNGIKPGYSSGSVVRYTTTEAVIGTDLLYARLLNDGTVNMPGGVLRPVNAQALKIPLPGGRNATPGAKALRKSSRKLQSEGFIFRKSVKIPARPMNTVTEQDRKEWAKTVSNYIAELLNGR